MTYERKLAPDQPAANDPKYKDAIKRYDNTDRPEFLQTQEEKTAAYIAELEAEVERLRRENADLRLRAAALSLRVEEMEG